MQLIWYQEAVKQADALCELLPFEPFMGRLRPPLGTLPGWMRLYTTQKPTASHQEMRSVGLLIAV